MIDAFEDTFVEEVWEGKSKTLWPLTEESPRNDHWKRRLRLLRLQFEHEMKELRTLSRENQERRHEIEGLQDHLFSGTSIQESRRSVELADITVQQGRNIKVCIVQGTHTAKLIFEVQLLTIVNLFFMPLTFVTSVYGMTNMSTEPHFWEFGITLATVCVPFFSLVGFLSTDFGYRLWMAQTKALWRWIRPKPSPTNQNDPNFTPNPVNRTLSTDEGMQKRLGHGSVRAQGQGDTGSSRMSYPNIQRMVGAINEGKPSGLARMGTLMTTAEREASKENESAARAVPVDVRDGQV